MCEHKNFTSNVAISRLEDIGTFAADIRINCIDCGIAFCFRGLQCGLSGNFPTVSPDAAELRVPIYPQGQFHREDTMLAGFKVIKENAH